MYTTITEARGWWMYWSCTRVHNTQNKQRWWWGGGWWQNQFHSQSIRKASVVHVVLFDFFGWHIRISLYHRHTSIWTSYKTRCVATLLLLALHRLHELLVALGKDRDDDRETYVIQIQIWLGEHKCLSITPRHWNSWQLLNAPLSSNENDGVQCWCAMILFHIFITSECPPLLCLALASCPCVALQKNTTSYS
jgi:hypothetical protein